MWENPVEMHTHRLQPVVVELEIRFLVRFPGYPVTVN
jgi:hypothetical protein